MSGTGIKIFQDWENKLQEAEKKNIRRPMYGGHINKWRRQGKLMMKLIGLIYNFKRSIYLIWVARPVSLVYSD